MLEGRAWWEWLYYSGAALPGVAALAEVLSSAEGRGPRMRELERLELRCAQRGGGGEDCGGGGGGGGGGDGDGVEKSQGESLRLSE